MWLTSDLLEDVKLRGFLPTTSNLTDAEILRIADSQVRTRIVPLVKRAEQEFWIKSNDQVLVSGQREYRITSDTILGELRKVVIVDPTNNEYDVVRTTFDRLASYTTAARTGWTQALAYALKGDMIVLTALPDLNGGSYTLRMYYYRRPPRLVEVSQCVRIWNGIWSGDTIFAPIPSSWLDPGGSVYIDLVEEKPNFDVIIAGAELSGPSGAFNFPGFSSVADPRGLYVVLSGTSCIVSIPDMMYDLLVTATIYQVLMTLGFMEQAGAFKQDLVERTAEVRNILEPRVRAPAEKVINRNSYLRGGRRS